jgi:hypothetical protein
MKFRQHIDKASLTKHRQIRFESLMKSSSSKLSPILRFVAAGMLLVWVAAVTACSTECSDSHADSADMTHAVAANRQSHDSDNHHDHDDSLCISLHSFCPATARAVLTKPDFGLAFTLDFISTAHLAALAQTETSVSRQPPDCNRVFTPEVCLGPAFHSLAPPVLA